MNRRNFLILSGLITLPFSHALSANDQCLTGLQGIDVESNDSAGYEHFHQLILPVSALITPPRSGIKLLTSTVDQGSFNDSDMKTFAKTLNMNSDALRTHNHEVFITYEELKSIASGTKNVEIKVYARSNKQYVHNFLITAPPSTLSMIKKYGT